MRQALQWAGYAGAAIMAGYFVWFAARTLQLHDLRALLAASTAGAMLLTACLYSSIIAFSAAAWSILLRRQGAVFATRDLAAIIGVAQLAKYVPGGFAQPVSRAVLALRYGMALKVFTISVLQESLLTVGASVMVGFLLSRPAWGVAGIPAAYNDVILMATVGTVVGSIFLALGSTLLPAKWRSGPVLSQMGGRGLGATGTVLALALYSLNYLAIGLGVWAIALTLGVDAGYFMLTAAFSLAWVIGFVIPGTPAGLGVRESVMVLLLSASLPQHAILQLVIATRLATLFGDAICFAIGLWCMHHGPRRSADHDSALPS
jgi:glycosyltransferase 2 family protein